ncbi:MAG: DUF58 domain-containing protein [Myxococcales bacterium]|nr:DUF58 domain-containing protein [Myxococcales bacterium]MDD9971681.1 DUF58 domain-containing protein [Myxococcales bacterium]
MLPVPTPAAKFAFGGCVTVLVTALIANSPTTAVLATGGLLGLALSLALTVAASRRMRRQRIELSWWHAHGATALGAAAVVGVPFEVCCELRNRSGRSLWLSGLSPLVPQGTHVLMPDQPSVWLAAATRTQVTFKVLADAAGRVVLQGLSVSAPGPLSLFSSPLYFPSPLTIKVLPQAAHRPVRTPADNTARSVERPGQTSIRRRGDGTELRELREHQPGDAFRSIAWKASAKRGKLLVREVEREVQDTLYLVVDISGSMRGGRLGRRRLDRSIELAAFFARDALERGDQVGLIATDGRIVEHVAPGDGLSHMLRIYDALLATTEVVAADLTEATDEEVEELVARYLRQQEGLDFRRPGRPNTKLLVEHARRALGDDPRVRHIEASDLEHAYLRRFCQVRGIPVPYRSHTRAFGKARGLGQAMLAAAGKTRVPRTIVTLSDFDEISSLEALRKPMSLVRTRAHRLVAVYPRDHLDAGGEVGLEQTAHQVLKLAEERRQEQLRRFFARARVPTVGVTPDAHPMHVVARVLGAKSDSPLGVMEGAMKEGVKRVASNEGASRKGLGFA